MDAMDFEDPTWLAGPPLKDEEVSEALGDVPTRTLGQWRWKGEGPPYSKTGRHVRYPRRKLAEWYARQIRTSTSSPGPGETRPYA
jgi:hypothetical protein